MLAHCSTSEHTIFTKTAACKYAGGPSFAEAYSCWDMVDFTAFILHMY